MAVVSSDFIAALLTNNQALFQREFDAATALQGWMSFTSELSSSSDSERYNWLGTSPVMEDVTQTELTLDSLYSFNFSISNLTYKAGMEVTRAAIEDDKLGLIQPRISQLAQEAARHPGQLVNAQFEDNPTAFNGSTFFNDGFTVGGSGTMDNNVPSAGATTAAAPTIAEMQTAIGIGRKTMRAFEDDKGRVMNLTPDTLVVPPNLEQIAYQALSGSSTPGSVALLPGGNGQGTNAIGGYNVYVNPSLTSDVIFYCLYTGGVVKPFLFQSRVSPSLEGVTTPNSESGVMRDRYLYSVRARYNVGVGDPRHAVKVTITT